MAWIKLKASDGHALRAWQAEPAGAPRGALVVLQEIFGANAHIRAVCDRYAAQDWLAVAPSLFDRADPEAANLGYTSQDAALGLRLKAAIGDAPALQDVQAAIDHALTRGLKVAVIGFCWGGTLAWLAAARLHGLDAVVAYYGTQIADHLGELPRVPVLLHFGEQDVHIPAASVQRIAAACPQAGLYRYHAGHGFNCDTRAAFDPASAIVAAVRTHEFLKKELAC